MKYMPIVPIGMFNELVASGATNAFMLSQFMEIEKYREFYTGHHWDTVILDNGQYEDSIGIDYNDMLEMADDLMADRIFVVGPEDLNNGVATGQMTIDLIDECGLPTGNTELMCILHEHPHEMKEQFELLQDANVVKDLGLGISIFSYRHGYDRGSLAKFVGVDKLDNYLHAFGWDNLLETYNLRDAGFDSIDSSIAVTSAVNGIKILDTVWQVDRNYNTTGRSIKRVNLKNTHFNDIDRRRSLENIIKVMEFVDPETVTYVEEDNEAEDN